MCALDGSNIQSERETLSGLINSCWVYAIEVELIVPRICFAL